MKESIPREDAFRQWLEDMSYPKSTASSTVRMVRRARELYTSGSRAEAFSKRYAAFVRRWLAFGGAQDAFTQAARQVLEAVEPAPTGVERTERITRREWRTLTETLALAGSPVDRALYALVLTPSPGSDMNDLLQMPVRELQKMLPQAAAQLLNPAARKAPSLAEYVCKGCEVPSAYRRLLKRLKALVPNGNFHVVEKMPVEKRWEVLQ